MGIKTDVKKLNELYAEISNEIKKMLEREDDNMSFSFQKIYRLTREKYLTRLSCLLALYGEKELREKGAKLPDWL